MGYSIELLFNKQSESKFVNICNNLEKNDLSNIVTEHNSKPHIALTVMNNGNEEKLIQKINSLSIESFSLNMYGVGTFNTKENLIFLIPKVTKELIGFHELVVSQFSNKYDCWEMYSTENWIPHCTVAMNLSDEDFINAFKIIKESFKQQFFKIEKIALVKFHPSEVIYERKL